MERKMDKWRNLPFNKFSQRYDMSLKEGKKPGQSVWAEKENNKRKSENSSIATIMFKWNFSRNHSTRTLHYHQHFTRSVSSSHSQFWVEFERNWPPQDVLCPKRRWDKKKKNLILVFIFFFKHYWLYIKVRWINFSGYQFHPALVMCRQTALGQDSRTAWFPLTPHSIQHITIAFKEEFPLECDSSAVVLSWRQFIHVSYVR